MLVRSKISAPTSTSTSQSYFSIGMLMAHLYSKDTGFECKLVQGSEGTNPLVLGRLGNDPNKTTLTYYGHYDVVPAIEEGGFSQERTELCNAYGMLLFRMG